MLDVPPTNSVCFGSFRLDTVAGELLQGDRKILLQEQPLQILKLLIAIPGGVVTRDEIRRKLWPDDMIVEFDHSINAALRKLRSALGDSPEEPRFIETVARRGYRLIVPVSYLGSVNGEPYVPSEPTPSLDTSAVGPSESPIELMPAENGVSREPGGKLGYVIAGGLFSLAIFAGAVWYLLRPLPLLRVTEYTQITHDGIWRGMGGTSHVSRSPDHRAGIRPPSGTCPPFLHRSPILISWTYLRTAPHSS